MKILIQFLTIFLCYTQTKDISKYINLSIEDLMKLEVTTASKKSEDFINTTGIVSVITKNEIKLFGARNLYDVLEKSVGILPYNTSSLGSYMFSIRADKPLFNNNHVLILLNGSPLSLESYIGGVWNQSIINSIPIQSIKQIEVVRGPSSVLYGSTAFTGVINIITSKQENSVQIDYGNFASTHIKSSHHLQLDKLNVQLFTNFFNTNGNQIDAISSNGTRITPRTHEKNVGLTSQITYKKTELDIFYGTTDQFALMQSSVPNYTYFDDGHIENTKLNLSVSSSYSMYQWDLKPRLTFNRGNSYIYPPDISKGEISNYKTNDIHSELVAIRELKNHGYLMIGTTLNTYSGNTTTSLKAWNQNSWSFFSNYSKSITETFRYFIGGQYNKEHDESTNLVPRTGFMYSNDTWNAKILYSESFRSPYKIEKEANYLYVQGNPNILSEKNSTYDINVAYKSGIAFYSLTLFDSHMKNIIIRDNMNRKFVNDAELHIRGLEFEHKSTIFNRYYTTLSYFYQKNHRDDGNELTTLQPSHHIKVGAGYTNQDISIGIFTSIISPYKDSKMINPTRLETHAKPHWIYNTSIQVKYNLGIYAFNLYIKNLLNQNMYVSDINEVNNTLPSFDQERRIFFGIQLNL